MDNDFVWVLVFLVFCFFFFMHCLCGSCSQLKGAACGSMTKPKIRIQTYIRTSAYVERTTKLDPEPPGMGTHTHGTPGDVHVPSPRGSGDHR